MSAERATLGLLVVGNIPLDLVVRVPRLPGRGEDVPGSALDARPGGAMHVIRAAVEGGASVAFGGGHGTGPNGDAVRASLAALGCAVLQPPLPGRDSGCVLVFVEPSGERAFVTPEGGVLEFDPAMVERLDSAAAALYVSGYVLAAGADGPGLGDWVAGQPHGETVFCDLGPRGPEFDQSVLAALRARADWLACNAAEAAVITGCADPASAAVRLVEWADHAGALVRDGARGCVLADPSGEVAMAPAAEVGEVVNASGAGDVHSGAFLAGLAAGLSPLAACAAANAAAARHVTRLRGQGCDT